MDRRILIADDDTDVRRGAAELLAGSGLRVVEAGDGDEALFLVQRAFDGGEPLHLALVDVHMPPPQEGESGLEPGDGGLALFSLLRGQRPDLPCILWSGEASEGVASWALREGASAFLRKPVKPHLLRDEVQRVLDEFWGQAG
ncbi:MAG: response regulator [Planctomycetota bacterium]